MEKRIFGKTGESLSVVGFGGMLAMDEEPKAASRLVAQAIERGINYFDVAPTYGNAEEILGPALEPYRSKVFLACKTTEKTKEKALLELQRSLKNLRTSYFDLYQLHGIKTLEEVKQIISPGGAMEAFLEAKLKGLVRFIGFSAHSEEAALSLMEQYEFDSILFPVNWVCWMQGNFGPKVIEKAKEKGIGILALKALAKRKWKKGEQKILPKCWYLPVETYEEASLAMRFTLSKPVTSLSTPGHPEYLWWACDAADKYKPLSTEEEKQLEEQSKGLDPIFSHRKP